LIERHRLKKSTAYPLAPITPAHQAHRVAPLEHVEARQLRVRLLDDLARQRDVAPSRIRSPPRAAAGPVAGL
jgi:hypothetical protein